MPTPTPRAGLPGWWRPAAVGLLACTLFSLHGFFLAYLPPSLDAFVAENAPWIRTRVARAIANIVAVACVLVLFCCWLALHPRRSEVAPLRRILAAWCLPFLPVLPVASGDAFAYAAQAWVLHSGLDPYAVPQGVDSPFSAGVYPLWGATTAVYPPLTLFAQVGALRLGGVDPYWSVVAMRLLTLLGLAVVVALLPRLARQVGKDERTVVWAAALNPLTVLVLVGGSHNDALMVACLAIALAVSRHRGGLVWAAIAIGVGACFKQVAVLALPGLVLVAMPEALRSWTRWPAIIWRGLVAAAVALATFLAISFGTGLGLGWSNPSAGNPGMVSSLAPLSWLLSTLRRRSDVDPSVVDSIATLGTVAMLAFIAWATWRWSTSRPLFFTAWCLLAFGLFGPAMQSWYFVWPGLFFALARLEPGEKRVLVQAVLALALCNVLTGAMPTVGAVVVALAMTWVWHRLFDPSPRVKEAR